MNKLTHKTHREAHRRKKMLFCMVALIGILFLLPMISSFEFDNWKSYDPINKKATIKNAFGLGDTLAEITLTENTYNCGSFCYAEGETTLYYQKQLIENLRFEKLNKGKWEDSNIIDYKIYINQSEETTQYKDVNGTTITNTETIWEEYNGQVLNPGTYKWRIEGTKNKYDTIDWLGTFFGKEIDEWAIWIGDSNMSFRFEDNLLDTDNVYNWTNQSARVFELGVVGQALRIDAINQDRIENSTFSAGSNWTYVYWLKPLNTWNESLTRVDMFQEASPSNLILSYDMDAPVDNDGRLVIFYDGAGGSFLSMQINFTAGEWQHLGFSFNGTHLSMYINGSLVNSTTSILGNSASTFLSLTGNGNPSSNFSLDELKFFKRSLSTSEIFEIYKDEIGFILNSETFNNETTEGATETFSINFTKDSTRQVSTVDLIYNTTVNSFAYNVNGDEIISIGSIIVPSIDLITNFTFFWNITFSDGSFVNTTQHNQSVSTIKMDNCSSFSQLIYNFSQFDEEDQTLLGPNTSVEVQINIFNTGKTLSLVNFSQTFLNTNPVQICLNDSILTSVNYSAYVIVKYNANISSTNKTYSTEYHNILNETIGNFTIPKLVNLFDLKAQDTTKFRLTFRDSNFIFAPDILVQIHRQYVADNDFKIVEIPITDSNGQTILNLVKNDIVYNFIMVDIAGNVIANFNEITAFCQDFTIGECTINLNAPATGSNVFNYNDKFDISIAQATFNNITKLVSVSFITGDLQPKTIRIEIYRNNEFGNRSVCTGSLTAASGLVSCGGDSITDSDQFLFIDIFVNNELAEQQTINLNADNLSFEVGEGSFYAFLLILLLITLFMEDRQVLLIAIGLGWVTVISLGLMKGAFIGMGSAGIWLLVTIAIFLWKLSKEEAV